MDKLGLLGYCYYMQPPTFQKLLSIFSSPIRTDLSAHSDEQSDITIRLILIHNNLASV